MGLEMKYFVLKPKSKYVHDPHAAASRDAMYAYANAIRRTDPTLAQDIHDWAEKERLHAVDLVIKDMGDKKRG